MKKRTLFLAFAASSIERRTGTFLARLRLMGWRNKEAKNLFDFKSRQTNKKTRGVVKKHNKKRRKREGPESQYAFNWCSQMFTHCNVLFNILMK